ncbi:arylsulfatase B [Rhodopirellula maiorica SM1]|uniref:Arylsulfatase B n=1 Tax=Rhodopirellula maiorica SM1 TaxID=1265738 RepID=M5RVZ1_9BACT|nr:sulfatase-like hydrolase/transferase [Rhodopirellula maiorica]EMI19567.1 arylsulfatase B [Rhodopirellula maiorica SM1]
MTQYVLSSFPAIRLYGVLILAILPLVASRAADPPNLIIILADDMGYGDLSCFGSKQIQTPNIDALADGGVRCTQGYVSGVVCAPSRAGLMTGRYQNRFGFEHNIVGAADYYHFDHIGLPTEEVTIADRLKALGYATACIGKWHLGNREAMHPNQRGFDYYFGRYKGHGYFPKVADNAIYRQSEPVKSIDVPYTTDWYTKEAIEFIQRTQDDQPFFLYLAHDTPHTPLQAKDEDLAKFQHIESKKRRTICAMQHCLDENIGRLVQSLKDTDRFENTLIVFFSDNGGVTNGIDHSINAPLRGQKAMFFDGGMHVPFIFSWPAGGLKANITYEQPFISLDLVPTFLAAAGNPWQLTGGKEGKRIYDGVNLLPFLRGERGDDFPHETLYWRITHRGAAIRDRDWKLIRTPHLPAMLFDLSTDPSEQSDLACERPEQVAKLMRKLAHWESSFEHTPRWFSSNRWMKSIFSAYDASYSIVQPE